MEPLVLRCRILAPYVPLRATSSESVPSVDIVYIVQRSITKTEFRKRLLNYDLLYTENIIDATNVYALFILLKFSAILKKNLHILSTGSIIENKII